jgi:hypothetical protein
MQSKLQSECTKHAQASYKCLEENPTDPSKCQSFFDTYKACRKAEHTKIIEDRVKSGQQFPK